MADPLTPAQRSALMSRVGQKNTKPELIVRRLLHSRGWRYRLHQSKLSGTPDLVFKSRHTAVFVHGCFWHGHDCKFGKLPKTRTDFWVEKISKNRARDLRKKSDLLNQGWRVLTVWQCSLAQANCAIRCIEEFLTSRATEAEVSLANMKDSEE